MPEYLVPGEYGEAEYVEKRSRFTGRVWRCETEEEALTHIKEMQKRYWDATHNVYAYIIRGGATRFSDDGEPSGTSGLPTLDVFRKGNIYNICCVVTRYFGGVLLGGGGLVRAYGHTAKLALDAAGICAMQRLIRVKIICPYSFFERVRGEVEKYGAVEKTDFGADVDIYALLREGNTEKFNLELADLTNGSVEAEIIGETEQAVKIS